MRFLRYLLLAVLLFACTISVISQDIERKKDDSVSIEKIRTDASHKRPHAHPQKRKRPRLKNKLPNFFFGFSYLRPIGDYTTDLHYQNEYDYAYSPPTRIDGGVSFEIGNIFWLDQLKGLPEQLSLGAMVVYASPQIFMDTRSDLTAYIIPGSNITDFVLSFKLGPSIAYNPTRNLFLEANFTAEPSFYFRNQGKPIFLMRYSPRVNIRFRPIYVGLGFSFGTYQKKNHLSNEYETAGLSQMRVTLGFNF